MRRIQGPCETGRPSDRRDSGGQRFLGSFWSCVVPLALWVLLPTLSPRPGISRSYALSFRSLMTGQHTACCFALPSLCSRFHCFLELSHELASRLSSNVTSRGKPSLTTPRAPSPTPSRIRSPLQGFPSRVYGTTAPC